MNAHESNPRNNHEGANGHKETQFGDIDAMINDLDLLIKKLKEEEKKIMKANIEEVEKQTQEAKIVVLIEDAGADQRTLKHIKAQFGKIVASFKNLNRESKLFLND